MINRCSSIRQCDLSALYILYLLKQPEPKSAIDARNNVVSAAFQFFDRFLRAPLPLSAFEPGTSEVMQLDDLYDMVTVWNVDARHPATAHALGLGGHLILSYARGACRRGGSKGPLSYIKRRVFESRLAPDHQFEDTVVSFDDLVDLVEIQLRRRGIV